MINAEQSVEEVYRLFNDALESAHEEVDKNPPEESVPTDPGNIKGTIKKIRDLGSVMGGIKVIIPVLEKMEESGILPEQETFSIEAKSTEDLS